MSLSKISFHFLIESTLVDIAHLIFVNTYELMTWEDITVRGDSYIIVTAAAASQALDSAWTLIEIEHEVEEIELFAILFVFEELQCKLFVLGKYSREILFCKSLDIIVAHNRLNGYLVKACFIKSKNVF